MTLQIQKADQTVDTPGASRVSTIPTELFTNHIQGRSNAAECFVNQRFSAKLRAFLAGYVASIVTNRSVYEE
jgi:hypothetical protein